MYVINGDVADRGDNSLEILVIVLMYKLLHPNRYALLLFYYWCYFTAALLLLYCCFTTALTCRGRQRSKAIVKQL